MAKDVPLIKELLLRYLRDEGLETPLNEHRLIGKWPEVVGNVIAQRTGRMEIANRVLYVQILSASLRNSLMYNRRVLVERLNGVVGATVIDDIVFR